jgi:hypothetical protein
MRVRGEFDRSSDGIRNLRDAGVPIEINFSPRSSTARDRHRRRPRYELGAYSFYTGRTMYTGNAVKAWRHLESPTSDTHVLRRAAREDGRVPRPDARLLPRGRPARGAALSVQHPAALLIVLPNGLVKLINALPFVCGDFRATRSTRSGRTSARLARSARRRVRRRARSRPGRTRSLHQWIPV